MPVSLGYAFINNFLGNAPRWYKCVILLFLLVNAIVFHFDPFIAGWLLVIEFIFTLTMALKCYPLQPGGLLAIEAMLIGMTSAEGVKHELFDNIEVLLLLIFMVSGIYFMKQLLLYVFTKLIIRIRSKILLSLAFCLVSAFLSAFLDALTELAVVISVAMGLYNIYIKVAPDKKSGHGNRGGQIQETHSQDLDDFRSFLRSLMMHAGMGTALGGVCTIVGEPQNLIIGEQAGWNFAEFAIRMSPVSIPVLFCGLLICVLIERLAIFGYGTRLPESIRKILQDYNHHEEMNRSPEDKASLIIQAFVAVWLIVCLAMHLAEVGLIGLSVLILITSLNGITEEHALGKAFQESLPFTALLTVFLSVVAVIVDQQLFKPVIQLALSAAPGDQPAVFYFANGILSMVSDNVFVGTIYIKEVKTALLDNLISREQFNLLAVAINAGTNLPSVATPNGQAAFLFMLTSSLAPLLRFSYGRMVWMALPYALVLSLAGFFAVKLLLPSVTHWFYQVGWLSGSVPVIS